MSHSSGIVNLLLPPLPPPSPPSSYRYAMDILQILATGLLMIKSFAASFPMSVDIVLPQITLDTTISLPSWFHWFPRALLWPSTQLVPEVISPDKSGKARYRLLLSMIGRGKNGTTSFAPLDRT